MKCPHCTVEIHESMREEHINSGGGPLGHEGSLVYWRSRFMVCPACKKAIIELKKTIDGEHTVWLVNPRAAIRVPAAPEVPADLASDYNEACAVVPYSAKASAALSRRCVQSLLRAQGYTNQNLAPAIQAALDAKQLPSWLADNLDAIRNVGNFAAHPMKDSNTGAIMEVEPHEAEWNLEVLEGLFDFYYVQPAKDAVKRSAFNAKLAAAGKPPMK